VLPVDTLAGFRACGLVTRAKGKPGDPPSGAEILLDAIPAASLACVAVGTRALLLVVERRERRVFTPDEWYWLRSIARQADAALERIELRALVA
jgi:GAF domain-containing protein